MISAMRFQNWLVLGLFMVLACCCSAQVTISGKVSDKNGGEDLPFASIFIQGTTLGTTSNVYGFYSLTIPAEHIVDGKVTVVCGFLGYANTVVVVDAKGVLEIQFELESSTNNIGEAVIQSAPARGVEELRSTEMSTTRLKMQEIRTLPSLGGETDIIKVLQLLPGVQGGNEGTTGLFVRGGDADQNLVLLDEATVYNTGHLFGFFSVFNPDAVKEMTLIKGAFPSDQGGRLSSILDIRMKDGHDQKIHANGGIGLLSSRLTVEGPIIKDKMSFLIAGRRTYIDKVFKAAGLIVPYHFYDINAKLNYKFSDKDRIFYSMYKGNDVLAFDQDDLGEEATDSTGASLGLDFGFTLGNLTNSLRWNHLYSPKLFSNISLVTTNFAYDITGRFAGNNVLIRSKVADIGVKADYTWFRSNEETVKFGGQFINHTFRPNIVSTAGEISEFLGSSEGEALYTQEFAVYGHSDREISDEFKVNFGLRISGALVKERVFVMPEPRLAMRYLLNEKDAVKLSYSRMNQYMHRVSSSTVALPTDLWYPITKTILPQSSDQIAFSYNHYFKAPKLSFTFESYYKWMKNLIEYREGANLVLNNDFESELLQGTGDAYGFEALFRRDEGLLTGWIGYTLSWATRDFDDLNGGKRYFAKYDRRHSASVVLNYQLNERWTASAVWVYQTGSRFTAQVGQYFMPNASFTGVDIIPIYTERNAVQMSASHRLDLNFTLHGRENKKFKSEWSFGCYNLYSRAQPYQVRIVPADDGIGYKYEQPGLFGFILSIAYGFSF